VRLESIFRTGIALGAVALGAAGVSAQSSNNAAPPSGSSAAPAQKVGIVDIRRAIISTAEGKQASAELQSQFAARSTELEALNKQILDIQKQLTDGANTLSEERQSALRAQGERLATQLNRRKQEYQEDLNNAQGEAIDRIGRKMLDVISRYSRENGFTLVLNSGMDNSPVLYNSTQVDITNDIIRLYDAGYPVKASSTTAPTQQKPAPKPGASNPPAQKPQ